MPAGGEREAFLAADYNAEMIEHIERYPHVRDRSIFVGEPDDIVDAPFGPGLPAIREWTERHFEFAGYVPGFDPAALGDRAALRAQLGYGDEPLLVISVGGSGVGGAMLQPRGRSAAGAARARTRRCARSSWPAPVSTRRPSRPPTGSRCAATSTSSTATWRRATSASSRAA